eukprot:m.181091 g.181091  ORF g.181091 m.181091 type:complete len:272 (+) comp15512_c0_seq13:126-941(+)
MKAYPKHVKPSCRKGYRNSEQKQPLTYICPVASCPRRNRGFSRIAQLNEHVRLVHGPKKFSCKKCLKSFALKAACLRHEKECGRLFFCACDHPPFKNKSARNTHARRHGHKYSDSMTRAEVINSGLTDASKDLGSRMRESGAQTTIVGMEIESAAALMAFHSRRGPDIPNSTETTSIMTQTQSELDYNIKDLESVDDLLLPITTQTIVTGLQVALDIAEDPQPSEATSSTCGAQTDPIEDWYSLITNDIPINFFFIFFFNQVYFFINSDTN